jgi:hypothetical protein
MIQHIFLSQSSHRAAGVSFAAFLEIHRKNLVRKQIPNPYRPHYDNEVYFK